MSLFRLFNRSVVEIAKKTVSRPKNAKLFFHNTKQYSTAKAHSVWVFGRGEGGQLAYGEEYKATPVLIEQLVGKRFVGGSANWLYTTLITDEGRLWTWGDNRYGQMGLIYKRNNIVYDPELIAPLKPLTALEVACGRAHTLVRTKEGLVFSFGNTEFGQLGHGTAADQAMELPRPIEALKGKNIIKIGTGFDHSVALRDDGRVYVWGYNGDYQLALGDESDRTVPVLHPDVRDVVSLSVGSDFTLALTQSGDIWGWGNNDIGQLGTGTTNTVPKAIKMTHPGLHFKQLFAGGFSALGVTHDNRVYRWGRFSTDPEPPVVVKPELLPFFDSVKQPFTEVAAGAHHFLALTGDGALYSWGLNDFGQLGTGDTSARDQPTRLEFFADKRVVHVLAGMEHSVVITESD